MEIPILSEVTDHLIVDLTQVIPDMDRIFVVIPEMRGIIQTDGTGNLRNLQWILILIDKDSVSLKRIADRIIIVERVKFLRLDHIRLYNVIAGCWLVRIVLQQIFQ